MQRHCDLKKKLGDCIKQRALLCQSKRTSPLQTKYDDRS